MVECGTDCAGAISAAGTLVTAGFSLSLVFLANGVGRGRRRAGRRRGGCQSLPRVGIATAVLVVSCEGGACYVKMKEKYGLTDK